MFLAGSMPLTLVAAANSVDDAALTASTSPVATTIASSAAINPVGPETILSVLLGLLGIIALILGLAWFAKRAGASGWSRTGDMKVVASLALGTRERLLVVDIANTQILLGVTAQSINQLHVFDEPAIKVDGSASSDFSQKLMRIMRGQGASLDPESGVKTDSKYASNNDKQGHDHER